jgi:hypothetical protein
MGNLDQFPPPDPNVQENSQPRDINSRTELVDCVSRNDGKLSGQHVIHQAVVKDLFPRLSVDVQPGAVWSLELQAFRLCCGWIDARHWPFFQPWACLSWLLPRRVLLLAMIYGVSGASGWFWVHLVAMAIEFLCGGKKASGRWLICQLGRWEA